MSSSSNPLHLTIVYERAEHGWTTATIPAWTGRGTTSRAG
jgi:hypothetical protein